MQCGMQSLVMSSVKLEKNNAPAFCTLGRKWNRQLTRPIFLAGAKMWSGNETRTSLTNSSNNCDYLTSRVPHPGLSHDNNSTNDGELLEYRDMESKSEH